MSEALAPLLDSDRALWALRFSTQKRRALAQCGIAASEPAWDFLLGLTIGRADQKPLAMVDLITLSDLSELDARRELAVLCEAGLTSVDQDADAVRLTRAGVAQVSELLDCFELIAD